MEGSSGNCTSLTVAGPSCRPRTKDELARQGQKLFGWMHLESGRAHQRADLPGEADIERVSRSFRYEVSQRFGSWDEESPAMMVNL